MEKNLSFLMYVSQMFIEFVLTVNSFISLEFHVVYEKHVIQYRSIVPTVRLNTERPM